MKANTIPAQTIELLNSAAADARIRRDVLSASRWWLVRTNGGEYFDHFHDGGLVGAGSATPVTDFSPCDSREDVLAKLRAVPGGVAFVQQQGWRVTSDIVPFVVDMQAGHAVIAPAKGNRRLLVGIISDRCQHEPSDPYGLHAQHRCDWLQPIRRPADLHLPRSRRGAVFALDQQQAAAVRRALG